MKKFMLALGLILLLVCLGWPGNNGFGTAPAIGQPPPPPGYYCDPYYYNCNYDNYYSAPYTDPTTQFFYYTIPQIGGEIFEEHEHHEYREHEGRGFQGHEGRGHERH
jgi:hypothetical protein